MTKPMVGLVMGSDSDYELITGAQKVFTDFAIPIEVNVISAHRDTEGCLSYAKTACGRGLKVLIAFAGMAAHLAGVLSANTTLPVIGVPLNRSGFNGLDALLSTVQMPSGVPVATVAVDGSSNAAHLAIRILALENEEVNQKLIQFQEKMKSDMITKSRKIQERVQHEN